MNEPCRDGNLELVKLFVEQGAEIGGSDSNKSTALLNAAVCGYTEICEYLIDKGADITEVDGTGFNAVALAAYATKPETVERLAKRGVDIHQPTSTSWTPVHYAYDDAEVTRVLIEAGADINHVADNYTPLLLAATYNKLDVVKVLLKHKPNLETTYDNTQANYGLTALGIAINNGYIDIARELLDAGASVNQKSANGSLCLAYPVANNNLPLMKLLLEYRPDLSLVNASGHTALHCIGMYPLLPVPNSRILIVSLSIILANDSVNRCKYRFGYCQSFGQRWCTFRNRQRERIYTTRRGSSRREHHNHELSHNQRIRNQYHRRHMGWTNPHVSSITFIVLSSSIVGWRWRCQSPTSSFRNPCANGLC
jgi:ankyrin repeat protein